jgi:hypothetical protein
MKLQITSTTVVFFPDAYEDGSVRSVDELKPSILPLRQRAAIRNEWLRDRLDNYLPELMSREGFDMWVVIAREYNEDPIIMSMLPEPFMYARRRTILLFTRMKDGGVERARSRRVIHPGVTTTDDVAWWMRQKMVDLGIEP